VRKARAGTYPSRLVTEQGDKQLCEVSLADITGAGARDGHEALSTRLPHTPHPVLTQVEKLGQLATIEVYDYGNGFVIYFE